MTWSPASRAPPKNGSACCGTASITTNRTRCADWKSAAESAPMIPGAPTIAPTADHRNARARLRKREQGDAEPESGPHADAGMEAHGGAEQHERPRDALVDRGDQRRDQEAVTDGLGLEGPEHPVAADEGLISATSHRPIPAVAPVTVAPRRVPSVIRSQARTVHALSRPSQAKTGSGSALASQPKAWSKTQCSVNGPQGPVARQVAGVARVADERQIELLGKARNRRPVEQERDADDERGTDEHATEWSGCSWGSGLSRRVHARLRGADYACGSDVRDQCRIRNSRCSFPALLSTYERVKWSIFFKITR